MTATTYRVRNKRNEDGSYTLSYGRGSRALTCGMKKTGGGWRCDDLPNPYSTMKECKERWGELAVSKYGSSTTDAPSPANPPSLSKGAVPVFKPSPPPRLAPSRLRADTPEGRRAIANIHAGRPAAHGLDPFAPRTRYAENHPDPHKAGQETPLGLLVRMVESDPDHKLPHHEDMAACLNREFRNHAPTKKALDVKEPTPPSRPSPGPPPLKPRPNPGPALTPPEGYDPGEGDILF